MNICKEYLPSKIFQKGFVLTCDRMRRYEGDWHSERKILFPEYVFLESEDGRSLAEEVRKCLYLKESELFSMDREEEKLLKRLCGENGNLNMSKGVIRQGTPLITGGPLKGMERQIRKINRHKRLAKVETNENFAGLSMCSDNVWNVKKCLADVGSSSGALIRTWRIQYLTAGLEIMEKIAKEK